MSNDLILSDPEIMGGTPCIKGTRLTVYAVAARIRGGESVAELLDGYPPEFTEAHVRAAIAVTWPRLARALLPPDPIAA